MNVFKINDPVERARLGIPEFSTPESPTFSFNQKVALVSLGVLTAIGTGGIAAYLGIGLLGATSTGLLCSSVKSVILSRNLECDTNELPLAKSEERYLELLNKETEMKAIFDARLYIKYLLESKSILKPGTVKIKLEQPTSQTDPSSILTEVLATRENERELPRLSSLTLNDTVIYKQVHEIVNNKKTTRIEGRVADVVNDLLNDLPKIEADEKETQETSSKTMLDDSTIVQGIFECFNEVLDNPKLTVNVLRFATQASVHGLTQAIFERYTNSNDSVNYRVVEDQSLKVDVRTIKQLNQIEMKFSINFNIIKHSNNEIVKKIKAVHEVVVDCDDLANDMKDDANARPSFVTDRISLIEVEKKEIKEVRQGMA